MSGSDEYGVAILIKSIKENNKPINIINKYHNNIKKDLKKLKISLNNYFRTSNKLHHKFSQNVFIKLYNKKFFKIKYTYQYYDKYLKQFLSDRFIIGICPKCNYKFSYSDICDNCGNILNVGDLKKPISILTKKKPILKKTLNFFIQFKKYKKFLIKLYKKYKKLKFKKKYLNFLKKNVFNKLKNRSITRDLKWGVKVPIKQYKYKVLYVWFEAILGYITSTINWSNKNNINWKNFWINKNIKLINFIGKDNIIFHTIFYPLIIKKYNNKFILPYYININEFLKFENNKISTSKNIGVFLNKFLLKYPDLIDSLRYSLIINMPINKDSNFTWENFRLYNNTILIGILGNFFNRVINLIFKYYNGYIPYKNKLNKNDNKILKKIYNYPKKINKLIKKYKFKRSLLKFIELARFGNKYISIKQPWKLKNKKKIYNIMYITSNILIFLSQISYIFLPYTNKKMLKILNFKNINFSNLIKKKKNIKKKHKINKSILLFKYISKKKLNIIKKNII
ncbi:MAG: methionine--tRNA ligase [Candidatus Shikimatogenerans sp. JK-2022]|nr:methionine--tRNA ligase [Candidatus Shikimatogenerans bostrichidophilus]